MINANQQVAMIIAGPLRWCLAMNLCGGYFD